MRSGTASATGSGQAPRAGGPRRSQEAAAAAAAPKAKRDREERLRKRI